jgi:hypothetical protein
MSLIISLTHQSQPSYPREASKDSNFFSCGENRFAHSLPVEIEVEYGRRKQGNKQEMEGTVKIPKEE